MYMLLVYVHIIVLSLPQYHMCMCVQGVGGATG